MNYEKISVNLREVQMEIFDILIEFDRICKENNIKYQMFAGSLLGTIRHEGFIPWDDDIDVCMTRDDYEKLENIASDVLNENFFFQTYKTDKGYNRQYAKIRKNNTLFVESNTQSAEMHQGFFIDVFPIDNVKPNTISGNLQVNLIKLFDVMIIFKMRDVIKSFDNPIKKSLAYLCHYFLKIINTNTLNGINDRLIKLFKNSDTGTVSHLVNGLNNNRFNKFLVDKESFTQTKMANFEGREFPIPKNYDERLRSIYGNYMKLPPEKEQKPHHGVIKIKLSDRKC